MVIIFWDLLMFDQIFHSPQMKRSVVISDKYSVQKLLTSCQTTSDLGF